MEYTSGSMGTPDFTNRREVYASYRFGSNQPNNLPSFSTTQAASAQFIYEPYKQTPGTLRYQNPSTIMHSYGIADSVKHGALGLKREKGTNFLDEMTAKDEYRTISARSMGFDAGGVAASTAAFSGASMFSGFLGGTAASIGVGMVASAAKDEYFENFRATQRVNAITSNIRGDDGSYGLEGNENEKIAKFIKKEGAKDMLLSSGDIEDILTSAQDSGMMNGVSSAQGVEGKAREMTSLIKSLMDAMGSSDVKGLVSAMGEFSRMGVSSAPMQKQMVHANKVASEYAGISEEAMKEHTVSAVANAKATGQDTRLAILDSYAEASNMGMLQQQGGMSSSMLDKRTFLAASTTLKQNVSDYNEGASGGISNDTKIVYASEMAKENGTTAAEEYKKLLSKTNSEQGELVGTKGFTNEKITTARFHKDIGRAMAAQVKGISDISTESLEFANMIETSRARLGDTATKETVAREVNIMTGGRYSSPESQQIFMAKYDMYMEGKNASGGNKMAGVNHLDRGNRSAVAFAKAEDTINAHKRAEESSGVLNQIGVGIERIKEFVSSEIVGGFTAAGDIQSRRKSLIKSLTSDAGSGGLSSNMNYTLGMVNEREDLSFTDKIASLNRLGGLEGSQGKNRKLTKDNYSKDEPTIFDTVTDSAFDTFETIIPGVSALRGITSTSPTKEDSDKVHGLTLELMPLNDVADIIGTGTGRAALEATLNRSLDTKYEFATAAGQYAWNRSSGVMAGFDAAGFAISAAIGYGDENASQKVKDEFDVHAEAYKMNAAEFSTRGTRTVDDEARAVIFGKFLNSEQDVQYTKEEASGIVSDIVDKGRATESRAENGTSKGIKRIESKRLTDMYKEIRKTTSSDEEAKDTMSSVLTADQNALVSYGDGVYSELSNQVQIRGMLSGKSEDKVRSLGMALQFGSDEQANVIFESLGIKEEDRETIRDTAKELKKGKPGKGVSSQIMKDFKADATIGLLEKAEMNNTGVFFNSSYLEDEDVRGMSSLELLGAESSGHFSPEDVVTINKELISQNAAGNRANQLLLVEAGKDLTSNQRKTSAATNMAFTQGDLTATQMEEIMEVVDEDDSTTEKSAAISKYLKNNTSITGDKASKIINAAIAQSTAFDGDSEDAIAGIAYSQGEARKASKRMTGRLKKAMGVTDEEYDKISEIEKSGKTRAEKDAAIGDVYSASGKTEKISMSEAENKLTSMDVFKGVGNESQIGGGLEMTFEDYLGASGGDDSLMIAKTTENTGQMVGRLDKLLTTMEKVATETEKFNR